MALSAFLGGGTSAIGNIIGTMMNYQYQKKLQDHQYKLNIKGLKESPTAQRHGLESAGYNPLLATNALSNASVAPASGVTQSTLGSDITAGATNAMQRKQVNASIENTNAQTEFYNQQSMTEEYKRYNLGVQTRIAQIEEQLKRKDLDYYDRRFYTEMLEMYNRAQAHLIGSNAQAINAKAISDYKNLDIDWARNHPYLFNINKASTGIGSFIKPR